MLRPHHLNPLLERHRSRAASRRTTRRTARMFDMGRPIALRCEAPMDEEQHRNNASKGAHASHAHSRPNGSRAVAQSRPGPTSFTAYVREAMALDPTLRAFEVEAFALPATRAVPAARAMHAGHVHPSRPEVETPIGPPKGGPHAPHSGGAHMPHAVAPRASVAQPAPSAIALPPARRSTARSQTPQEALQEHWATRDARGEAAPLSSATSQEQAALDAIRATHARPPVSRQTALPAALPPPAPAPAHAPEPALAPRPEHPHDVFDRMASSLAYANTFDAGPVRLQRRFDQMNAQLDHEERRETLREERAAATAQSQSEVDDLSLMQDLVSLRDRLALLPTDPMQEPPGPLPPEATGAALPAQDEAAAAPLDAQSLQQDVASLRERLGNPEQMNEPPGPLPAPSEAAAVTETPDVPS